MTPVFGALGAFDIFVIFSITLVGKKIVAIKLYPFFLTLEGYCVASSQPLFGKIRRMQIRSLVTFVESGAGREMNLERHYFSFSH